MINNELVYLYVVGGVSNNIHVVVPPADTYCWWVEYVTTVVVVKECCPIL